MTHALTLPSDGALRPLMGLADKRAALERLIDSYATGHAWMDVGIGLTGFIPIPGAGLASMVAAIAAQAPVVYQPLSREIARIYARESDRNTGAVVRSGAIAGGLQDAIADVGVTFLQEIIVDVFKEAGLTGLLSAVPFFGGFVATAIEAKIAYAMTWRVGYAVALYHEYGGQWVGGSRAATYRYIRYIWAKASKRGASRPTLAELVERTDPVRENQELVVRTLASMLLDGGLTKAAVRVQLLAKGFAPDTVERVLGAL